MIILLEYNWKQGFHHNTTTYNQNSFSSPLFTHGWYPVCVIPSRLRDDPEYNDLLESLENERADYKTVVETVVYWVMKKLELEEHEP